LFSGEVEWICARDRPRTDPLFETLNPIDGKISGAGKKFILKLKENLTQKS
jgi:EH domain-containing protein 1